MIIQFNKNQDNEMIWNTVININLNMILRLTTNDLLRQLYKLKILVSCLLKFKKIVQGQTITCNKYFK